MKIKVKYTCKPNGQRELGLGKDYSLDCWQTVELPWLESAPDSVKEWLAGNLAVNLAAHVRAAVGNVKSIKGEKIVSDVSLAEWREVVDAWNGRVLSFDAAIASPTATASLADTVRDAKELYASMVALEIPADKALELVIGKYGIDPTK